MPSVIETLTSTAIFLFAGEPPAPIGTGFVVGYPRPDKPDGGFIPFVVTARHVVGDRSKVFGRFSTTDPKKPGLAEYDIEQLRRDHDYFVHPDEGVDIVVFRTPVWKEMQLVPVPYDLVATRKAFEDEAIQPTDRIVFPSLLVNFIGTGRNYPVMRTGAIALMADEKVPIRYKMGGREVNTEQEVLLANATAASGASGSPVFLDPGPRAKATSYTFGTKPMLLGVVHGFYPAMPRDLIDVEATETKRMFQENSGIAIIFPAWRIREIIDSDDFQKRIKDLVKEDDAKTAK
jgi:hypothetical protein